MLQVFASQKSFSKRSCGWNWNTDDECQEKKEPTTAAQEIIESSDEAALLSDSSNSNCKDPDNDEYTLTTTNQSRTVSAYSVVG